MKILITGGSGFLGRRLAAYYQSRSECIVPSHAELEICDRDRCHEYISRSAPDYVIHTAAISDTGVCERRPEESYRINVTGTEHLAKACAAVNSRMIFMSSDQVYNGSGTINRGNRETDNCRPVNVYGRQKLEAEQRVLQILPDALVLRLSWMYDLPSPGMEVKANFLTGIITAVNLDQPAAYSRCDYRGITHVDEVVQNIGPLLGVPGGIYNFGSDGEESVYQLAEQVFVMLGAAGRTDSLLQAQAERPPRNLRMDGQRLGSHGIHFSSNREGILTCLRDKFMTA